jgi:guanine deaminase
MMPTESHMDQHQKFLAQAVQLARENVRDHKGRPFGAVLVNNGEVIATGINEMVQTGDPTTHAEMQAIRAATVQRKSPRLDGITLYASGQPCPMCLSAAYLTGVGHVLYAYSGEQGEPYGFSTAPLYAALAKPPSQQPLKCEHMPVRDEGESLYAEWLRLTQR